MANGASSLAAIDLALPTVQAAVREEIAGRIAAGEAIGRVEGDRIVTTLPADVDLAECRKQAIARGSIDRATMPRVERKLMA